MTTDLRTVIAEDPGRGGLQVLISAGPAGFVVDEPASLGGLDLGPTPHDLLCAALAACTAQTLRLYAGRKQWALGQVTVSVSHRKEPALSPPDVFTRAITLGGDLDEAQRQRLLEIAQMCPVHKLLTNGARISTQLA